MNLINFVRWIHILTGAAWLGEVATIAFVILPTLSSLERDASRVYIAQTFPRLFRLATYLATGTLLAGAALNYLMTGWQNLLVYFSGVRGNALLAGALLGGIVASIHFFAEAPLERKVQRLLDRASDQEMDQVLRFLRIVPRIGVVLLALVVLLMMIGARGL